MLASGFGEEECAMEKISEGWFGFSSGATKKVGGGIVGFRDNQVHAREFCPTYTILGYGFEVSF